MNRVKVLSIVAGIVVFANIIKLIMMGQCDQRYVVIVAILGVAYFALFVSTWMGEGNKNESLRGYTDE